MLTAGGAEWMLRKVFRDIDEPMLLDPNACVVAGADWVAAGSFSAFCGLRNVSVPTLSK